MKEITDKKDNQMEEPKYDKSLYTLKEAIKNEVKNILVEVKDNKEDDKEEKKATEKHILRENYERFGGK